MFVACWRWDAELESWFTTSESVNVDNLERVDVDQLIPDLSADDEWMVFGFTTTLHRLRIAGPAPREHCLELLGLMLEGCGGRWPLPDSIPFAHEIPGAN